jgi:hypothetical protein
MRADAIHVGGKSGANRVDMRDVWLGVCACMCASAGEGVARRALLFSALLTAAGGTIASGMSVLNGSDAHTHARALSLFLALCLD